MRSATTALLGLVLWLSPTLPVQAAPTPTAVVEVNYLLAFAGTSACSFYRNGKWYESGAAQGHLRYKYEVLVAHDQIVTAEDFIEKAATRSSMSGRAYKVRCPGGSEVTSSQWLRQALAHYRNESGAP